MCVGLLTHHQVVRRARGAHDGVCDAGGGAHPEAEAGLEKERYLVVFKQGKKDVGRRHFLGRRPA